MPDDKPPTVLIFPYDIWRRSFEKKKPLKKYGKETGLKPIIGVRGSESLLRSAQYGNKTDDDEYGEACFTKTGKFSPLKLLGLVPIIDSHNS